jgi:ABC-type glycerol-3-phosphate transport system substrate-binding protein
MRKILLIGACVALAACGGAEQEAADGGEAYEDRETVFDPMTDTIDRAKEVEEMGTDRKKAMDEALEDAEGRSE